MKAIRYLLTLVLLAVLLYLGLVRTGYITVQPTPVLSIPSHTVTSHSRVEESHSKSHSTVEVTQYPELCVTTGVPAGYLNLRQDAGMQYAVVTVLHERDRVSYLSDKADWKKIKLSNGLEGFVYSKYIGGCDGQ